MGGKGQSHKKKIEKFNKEHPEGRKEFAKAKRLAKLKKRGMIKGGGKKDKDSESKNTSKAE